MSKISYIWLVLEHLTIVRDLYLSSTCDIFPELGSPCLQILKDFYDIEKYCLGKVVAGNFNAKLRSEIQGVFCEQEES